MSHSFEQIFHYIKVMLFVVTIAYFSSCELPKMDEYRIQGVDVSNHQGIIEWSKVEATGMRFSFIKATEGVTFKDKSFDRNWGELRETKLLQGAYHFYLPSRKAEPQAKHFINTVQLKVGDLPPVLDVEVTQGMPAHRIRLGMKIWLELVEQHYGVKPIIYTNQKFYSNYLMGHFREYPIWMARYGRKMPLIDTKWKFWQYTSQGRIDGIEGDVDLNVFYDNEMSNLKALCVE